MNETNICPQCGKNTGKLKRCFSCNPKSSNGPKSKATPKAVANQAKPSNAATIINAAYSVQKAIEGLDYDTAIEVLGAVLDRIPRE